MRTIVFFLAVQAVRQTGKDGGLPQGPSLPLTATVVVWPNERIHVHVL